jgi:hypothetical protein
MMGIVEKNIGQKQDVAPALAGPRAKTETE